MTGRIHPLPPWWREREDPNGWEGDLDGYDWRDDLPHPDDVDRLLDVDEPAIDSQWDEREDV